MTANDSRTTVVQTADTDRTIADAEVQQGASTTVTVSADYDPELEEGELARIDEAFSPGFADVEVTQILPGGGSGGPGPDEEELLVVWNEDADSYSVTYEVTVPDGATPGDQYSLSGTFEAGDSQTSLPSGTIEVAEAIPEETTIELRPADVTASPNDETTVDVDLTGLDAGVSAYELTVTASDTDVGAFTDYDLTNAAATDDSSVAGDGSSVTLDVDLADDIEPTASATVAELTLETGELGEADLDVDGGATVSDTGGGDYDLDSVVGATLSVVEGWWVPYTDDDDVASSAGQHVIPAINDFEDTGDPSASQVVTLIQSFESSTPVPDLID